MIFRDFAERLLGSKVKLRLLNHLLAPYGDGFFATHLQTSEREFAALVGISHTAVGAAFEDFYDANLVRPVNVGTSKMWIVNSESYAFESLVRSPLTELFRRPPLFKLESLIRTAFSKHIEVVESAVIYGSIATKLEMPSSDIDLMILVKTPITRADKVLRSELEALDLTCRKLFGNTVSLKIIRKSHLALQPEWVADAMNKGIWVALS